MHSYRKRLSYDFRDWRERGVYWPSTATAMLWCSQCPPSLNRHPDVINLEYESLAIKISGGFND